MRRSFPIAALCLILAGCAAGPDFQRPAPPDVQAFRSADSGNIVAPVAGIAPQHYVVAADIPAQWWQLFRAPALDALVARALEANPNLDAARAALRVARENAAAQGGSLWPQIGLNLQPSRQKIADSLSSPLNSGASIYSLHTAQVNVAYTADVFGGNRRAIESLEAQAEVQRFELEAARLSLAANVVAAAIQEAALRGQLSATERIARLQTEMLALAHRQFELGAIAETGVLAQEAALAQTRAALPPLRKQLAQTRDLLTALTGGFPDKDLAETFDLDGMTLPHELPLSLPSRLVEQRPDVRAAEAQAHAASAQVGVTFASMLPQFGITAGVGSVAARFGDLFKAGTGFWGLAGTLAQPIFEGGALTHRKAAAEAAYDQALAQYRAAVLAAFQNVADTLHALDQDADALGAATAALDAATRSLAIARRQVELGDISHLALLNSEQVYQQALLNHVQARASRYADTAALFQALGGGWWTVEPEPGQSLNSR
jgi:NodT family efflux transporter outer membrane factor (OMF) lipoprotein